MALIDGIKKTLRDTLALGDYVDGLDASSPLLGTIPELDSMGVVSVLTVLENDYDIVVEDDEISAAMFETLGSLTEFIQEKTGW